MSAEKSKIFFENVIPFQPIDPDGLIKTEPFLEAARCIIEFVDMLGTTFTPVKNDIEGNINKLTRLFQSNPSKFQCLNDIVKVEKQTLTDSEFHIGTDALTWLNRALIYNQLFLLNFLKDYRDVDSSESNLSDDIGPHFTQAYQLSLEKHHNWFVKKIFRICLMAAPSRTTLLTYLGYPTELPPNDLKELICQSIEGYLTLLKTNTNAVSILLLSHGFQP